MKTKAGNIPELDSKGRKRWSSYIDARIAARSLQQSKIALVDLADSAPEMSRIRSGDSAALRRLFGAPKRVEGLEDTLKIQRGQLLQELNRCAATEGAGSWHGSFPGVSLEEVMIPHCFHLFDGKADTLDELVELVRAKGASTCVWVFGSSGSGARTLASQLASMLGATLVDAEPEGGWGPWRRGLGEVAVALAGATSPLREGDFTVSMEPWTDREVGRLIDKLAKSGRLTSDQVEQLEKVGRELDGRTELLGPVRGPRSVIATLATYMRDGVPESGAEARSRALNVAWEVACRSDSRGRLGAARADLMEQFWAQCWRSAPFEWARPRRSEALSVLEGLIPVCGPERVRELIETVGGERAKRRRDELLRELSEGLSGPPEVLLESLIASDLLREEGESLVAAEPDLARAWLARGLRADVAGAIKAKPERVCDDDFVELMRELAQADVPVRGLLRLIQEVPVGLCLDLSIGLMHFLAERPGGIDKVDDERDLYAVWSTALWAMARRPFERVWSWDDSRFDAAARAVSRRFREQLPLLGGPDFLASLEGHVPERITVAFGKLVEVFGPFKLGPCEDEPNDDGNEQPDGATHEDYLRLQGLMRRAPFQAIAWSEEEVPRASVLEDEDEGRKVYDWIEQLARSGSSRARRLLSGASRKGWGPSWLWGRLPEALRWRWLGVDESEPPWDLWHYLVGDESTLGEEAIAALRRFGSAEVERRLLEPFEEGRPRLPSWVLQAAVALGVVAVLERFARRPALWVRDAHRWGWTREETTFSELETVWNQAAEAAQALHRLGRPEPLRALWRRPVARLFGEVQKVRAVSRWSPSEALRRGFPIVEARDWAMNKCSELGVSIEDYYPYRGRGDSALELTEEELLVSAALLLLRHEPPETENPVMRWARMQETEYRLKTQIKDAEEAQVLKVGLILVACEDEALWEREECPSAVRSAMCSSAIWLDRLYARSGADYSLLSSVPVGREPSWFWGALATLELGMKVQLLGGRAADEGRGRAMLEERWRSALVGGRLREAAIWAAVAANDQHWPAKLMEETLQRWMLEDPEPFSGAAWFVSHRASEGKGGWASFFNLLEAWVARQETFEAWVGQGVERLWHLRPDRQNRKFDRDDDWGDVKGNFGYPHDPLLEYQLFKLARAVDAVGICESAWASEVGNSRRDELAQWRLGRLKAEELESLLDVEPWGPYAARRLVEMGSAKGRRWLLERLPETAEQTRENPGWDQVCACLPLEAIERLEQLLAGEATTAGKVDLIQRHRRYGNAAELWFHLERSLRCAFNPGDG